MITKVISLQMSWSQSLFKKTTRFGLTFRYKWPKSCGHGYVIVAYQMGLGCKATFHFRYHRKCIHGIRPVAINNKSINRSVIKNKVSYSAGLDKFVCVCFVVRHV